jgi:DNA polymerase-3 subunit gamma/tau
MSLYLKYRPSSLEAVKGNSEIVNTLESMLSKPDTCPHVFLLHGATGCGKTTLARIIANRLNCVGSDLKEIDSADFRGIDSIREIRKNSNYKPIEGDCRVWILDETHKLTNDAQNALLKILEDTPSHVYFILCTTDPQKLIAAIKGRCIEFQVKPLSDSVMHGLLKKVVRGEQETLDDEVYTQIIQDSQGHPRNALQILEQVLNASPEKRLSIAKQTAAVQSQAIDLCRALIKRASWKEVSGILASLKEQEPEDIRRVVMGYCQAILLKSDNTQAGMVLEHFIEPFYNSGFPALTLACYLINKN